MAKDIDVARNIATGKMAPETLKGFIAAARDLKLSVTDEEGFLQEQQEEVFRRAPDLTLGA